MNIRCCGYVDLHGVWVVVYICMCLVATGEGGFTCPQKNGLFPAGTGSSSCGKYYECSRGEPKLQSCPDNQGFHREWKQCSWRGFVDECLTRGSGNNNKATAGQACGVVEGGEQDNGSNDPRKETPWVVAVFQRDRMDQEWEFASPGAIVGPTTVLTSCRLGRKVNQKWRFSVNASSFQVATGLESLDLTTADEFAQLFEITSVQMNPQFSDTSYDHCNAILHLKNPINFDNPYAKPVCLPFFKGSSQAQKAFGYAGTGKITGFREKRENSDGYPHLSTTNFRLTSQAYCFAHTYQWQKYCGVAHGGGSSKNLLEICMGHQTVSVTQSARSKRWFALGLGSHFNNDVCSIRGLEDDPKLSWIANSLKCGSSKFPCNDGTCINLDAVCNNEPDCPKGEDENSKVCRAMNPCISNDATFECGVYENCIPASKVCDGYPDCYDASDENAELCKHAKRKNNVPFYVTTPEVPSDTPTEATIPDTTYGKAETNAKADDTSSPASTASPTDAIQSQMSSPTSASTQRKCPEIEQPEGTLLSCSLPGSLEFSDCSSPATKGSDIGTMAKFRCNSFYRAAVPSQESLIKKCTEADSHWRPERNLICVPDCGRLPPATNAYIVNGQKANSVDRFPWHVAIFVKSRSNKYDYICGGTLIHRAFVLTAAHCVTDFNGDGKKTNDFTVLLAPSSINYKKVMADSKARLFQVKKIMVNPHYDPRNNYQSDISILALSSYAELGEKVMIACLPSEGSNDPSPGTMGKVPGFGYDESGKVSEDLKFTNLPIVSTETCRQAVGFIPSSNQICAGYSNGTGVCFGDSGGGLVVFKNDRFYLQGIVSVGPKVDRTKRELLSCDHNTYSVYTSVPRFADWINSQINMMEIDI